MKLSDCTSLACQGYDCDYCPKCSHAIYRGSATIDGRKYTWEHNPYHGPLFACAAIGKEDWLPHHRHAVWKAFSKWHDRHFSNSAISSKDSMNANIK
jgi:hypothetical protein